jgi:hypothetical protein
LLSWKKDLNRMELAQEELREVDQLRRNSYSRSVKEGNSNSSKRILT